MLNRYAYRNHLMITNEYYNHHPDYGSDLFSSIHLEQLNRFLERRPYIGAWVGVITPFILYRLQYFIQIMILILIMFFLWNAFF